MTNQVEQEKKIKTESGNWIKQSFKTGKYTEYLEKSKAGLLAEDSGDEDANQYVLQFIIKTYFFRNNMNDLR